MKSDNLRSSIAASRDSCLKRASVIQTLTHSVFLSDSDMKKAPLVRRGRNAGRSDRRGGNLKSAIRDDLNLVLARDRNAPLKPLRNGWLLDPERPCKCSLGAEMFNDFA